MPTAIIVSAISTGSDTLTASAHGLLTGDRFRLRPVGGTVPVSTPAIAAVTDLFAIKVDNNTIRVATSSANALAGTYVDITGTGTATTLYLEYGLPYVIPRVATPGQQVFSADENATWNSLVALHALLTGQSQSVWSSVTLAGALDVAGLATLATLSAADVALTGPVKLTGIVTPAALSAGNNNNYNPTGLATANVLRVGAATGSPFITGIAGGTSGRVLHIVNVNTDDVTITHEDGSSTAANRFTLPNSTASVTIRDGGTMTVWYDGTSSRWRPLSQNL